MMNALGPIRGGIYAGLMLVLGGCMVGPDFVRPNPPETARYLPGESLEVAIPVKDQAQYFDAGADLIADWWRLFKSPKLNALVTEGINNNQSLRAAQAALRQSQHNLLAGYGVFFPQADAAGSAVRQRFSAARFGGSTSATFNLFTLSTTVTYALDVFGGQRRAVESLRAQRDFQRYTVLATYLTLTGNIVNTVIARAAYDAQIEATKELIALQREQIEITRAQIRAGTVPYISGVTLQTQLASLEATLPALEQGRGQAEHLLDTLMNYAPGEGLTAQISLADLSLPKDLPVTLPSTLVRQRPDILAAEAQVHQFTANIGVATANMLPSFTLSGTYGQNARNLADVFMSSGNFWSAGAAFVAPIFHGGTLWQQRKAAIDAYDQALANYRQTALNALGQIADLLLALEHDAETLQSQLQHLDSASEALRLVRINHQAGLVNDLQVLITNSQYLQAKLGYIGTLGQRFQDTSGLFVALGGGWWNAEEEGELTGMEEIFFNPDSPVP
ncbi:efflux transporter outer membrane subunit [Nitrosospira multiformis]|uniref:efflux transporter outer membrane subunit n=1 Tax=Nitrosospira multiformis TaxID=1231 RepID=UPI0009424F02|nr:efflux transporter outer membrane subunit [Nitrosospira multiformis]